MNSSRAPSAVASLSRLLPLVLVAFVAACPQPVQDEGCKSDLDCGLSQTCDLARGLCKCIDDNACDTSEFCNVAGSCQLKLECLDNTDCRSADVPNDICDSTSGSCLTLSAQTQCVLDSQCPYGTFCNDFRQCEAGCRENGDCNLGEPCIDGQCDPTPGSCNNNSFCDFGQICSNDRCQDHAQKDQLCSQCGPTDLFSCPSDCLIDSSITPKPCNTNADCDRGECLAQGGGGGGAFCLNDGDCDVGQSCDAFTCVGGAGGKICQGFFCGASDCDDVTNPCPRGYSCFTLQLVSGIQCALGSGSAECGAPRSCNGGGENGEVGFCSCASDADCPVGQGATCRNPGPNGSCVVGTTCGPSDGLLCEDILP